MPLCKLVAQQNPRFQVPGNGKFFDNDSYQDLYCYLRGIHNTNIDSNRVHPQKEKMTSDFHGSRCVDYYRAPQEMEALAMAYGKYDGTKVRHYIISLSPEECSFFGSYYSCCLALQDIAERFLDCFHGQYQCFYVIHEDTDNPHAHVCCSTVNFQTGLKYPGDKKSYFGIQNEMDRYIREQYNMRFYMVPDVRE